MLFGRIKQCGSCRMCLVEIKGNENLIPACTSKIKEGMEVITNSEKLKPIEKWFYQ